MPFPTVIDNTMRSAFVSCPQHFMREYMQNLSPVGQSVHLHAGGCFAHGLEIYRKAYYGEHLPADVCLGQAGAEMIKFWGDFESPEGSAKTLENMLAALAEYFIHYPPASDHVKPHILTGGKPAVEFTFALPLPDTVHPDTGEEIIYAGSFDMLGEYNGMLFVVDEKTTTRLGEQWIRQWQLRSQFTGYVWGAKQFGYDVQGAIIRGISILKRGFGHAEPIIYRPQWQIDRWYKQLLIDIDRMIQCYKLDYWDYDLSAACSAYSGCPYLRLCDTPEPENWIHPYYIRRVWNPVTRTETILSEEEWEAQNGQG